MSDRNGLLRAAGYCLCAALLLAVGTSADTLAAPPDKLTPPLVIEEFGSLSAGAQVLKDPGEDGGEFHHDYLYSNFVIPKGAREHSLVLWHGCLGGAWERRPDGGPGFQSLLAQRRFPVFVFDSPRQSRGARGLGAYSFDEVTSGANPRLGPCGWNLFRYGEWFPPTSRTFFPGVQLAQDADSAAALCQLNGSPGGPPEGSFAGVPFTAVDAVSALLDKKAGDSVLVTHSFGGHPGWVERIKNDKVKGIVSYEPVRFLFPSDAPPDPLPGCCVDPGNAAIMEPIIVSPEEFDKLTQIPIQIVWGDNLDQAAGQFSEEQWRLAPQRAQQFADAVNSRGGNVEILHLPDIGVFGNTHFPFFDLNNEQIADLLVDFLKRNGLDK